MLKMMLDNDCGNDNYYSDYENDEDVGDDYILIIISIMM